MKRYLINIVCFCIGAALLCIFNSTYAQSIRSPKIVNPDVANLEKFGDVPVDLNTGVPNISIPVHNLHFGNINVPISLRYHPGNVRVAQHEGWVGLGWNLDYGGSITRKVNTGRDEYYAQIRSGWAGYFSLSTIPAGKSGSELVNNNTNWNTITALKSYWSGSDPNFGTDYCADEFSFSFLGYSGKFYYSGPVKGWQVVCDQDVKVELSNPASPFLSAGAIMESLKNQYPIIGPVGTSGHLNTIELKNSYLSSTSQVFAGFTLSTPEGTKYYFGGVAGLISKGVEFSANYNGSSVGDGIGANTWLLTKIVDTDGNTIDYTYSADYPTTDLGFGYLSYYGGCQINNGGSMPPPGASGGFTGVLNPRQLSGTLNMPLYLDKISCLNETVTFNHSMLNPANSLRYPNGTYDIINFDGANVNDPRFPAKALFDQSPDGTGHLVDGATNLQWEQLNSIQVKNGNGQIYKTYNLNYTTNASTRLKLINLLELDKTGTSVQKYSFGYNTAFPPNVFYSGNYTDHWGFYNGKDITSSIASSADVNSGSIFANKISTTSAVTNEILNKIIYPTGGSTEFTWEAHTFSEFVASDRQSLIASTSWPGGTPSAVAGGSRIAAVRSYLPDGSLSLNKRYLYVRNYTGTNNTSLSSSGILNGKPGYNLQLQPRLGFNGTATINLNAISLNSFANYSYNSQSSYIGYNEVVELDADGSYTINYFTAYGPDRNQVSHFDQFPSYIGWLPGDVYFPLNTLERERGKIIAIEKYNNDGILVQSVKYTYRSDPERFNDYIRLIDLNSSYSGCGTNFTDALILTTAHKKFRYNYYLTDQSVTNFDRQGKNPIVTTESYKYNAYNLVSLKTQVNSEGEALVTSNIYTTEATDAISIAMAAAHIITPIVQTTISRGGNPLSYTQTDYFLPAANMYKPKTVSIKIGVNPLEVRQGFNFYDKYGNIAEMAKTQGAKEVYLWSYNGQYPVAKITGATLAQVNAIVTQVQIDGATSIPNNDANIRLLLKNIQTGLLSAFVTYYTYLPLTGITSETDPKGLTTFYEYDAFQRLQAIKDFQGNVLKTFNYQYQVSQ